jgi:hypothetical protein
MKDCLELNTITPWKHKIYKMVEQPCSTKHTINQHPLTKTQPDWAESDLQNSRKVWVANKPATLSGTKCVQKLKWMVTEGQFHTIWFTTSMCHYVTFEKALIIFVVQEMQHISGNMSDGTKNNIVRCLLLWHVPYVNESHLQLVHTAWCVVIWRTFNDGDRSLDIPEKPKFY